MSYLKSHGIEKHKVNDLDALRISKYVLPSIPCQTELMHSQEQLSRNGGQHELSTHTKHTPALD